MRELNCVCCDVSIDTSYPHQKRVYCEECRKAIASLTSELSHIKVAKELNKQCIDCGKQFSYASIRDGNLRCKTCSGKHRRQEKSHSWKGGIAHREGYIWLYYTQAHPHKSGNYVAEHVLKWEEYNHKPLPKGFTVHHLNGIKADNRGYNLIALPHKQHSSGLLNQALRKRIKILEELLTQQKLI